MSWSRTREFVTVAAVLVLAATRAPAESEIERGRYLVEEVAQCQECHTPRDTEGEFDRARWLQGGSHNYKPVRAPGGKWVERVPALAGLPGWLDDRDVVTLLTTGKRPDGRVPSPPMKQFHLRPADARAVVAYLRSLAPAETQP